MKRYELAGRRKLAWTDRAPVPVPGPAEVLIRVGAGTVCNRSDLVYYHYLGEREHCGQGVFGHEIAGTVEAVGSGVSAAAPGDRVFVRTPLTSGFAEFALAREIAVGKLPAQVADLDPWRLERSASLGAHRTVSPTGGDRVEPELLGADFDVAIDAVGTPHTVNACVGLVRRNGLVVLLGTHHVDTQVSVDLIAWEKKGLRVHTAAEPTDADRAAAMAVAQRLAPAIALTPLLTETYPLERLPEAIERLSASSLLYPAGEASPFPGPPPRTLKLAIVP